MKKLFTLLLSLVPFLASAQDNTSGEIIYKETMRMDMGNRQVPDHVKEMMKTMPKEHSFKKHLVFNEENALFKSWEDPNAPVEDPAPEGGGGMMRMMMMRTEEETYNNFAENRVVQQKDFMGRTFLIRDTLEKSNWKITGQQKEILGYPCMEATTMKDSMEIKAWFTPSIPVFCGPEGLAQLPGMILEASMREGKFTVVAEKVEFRKVKKNEIYEPEKGKEITREEYKKMVEEKRKEMREAGGKGGEYRVMH